MPTLLSRSNMKNLSKTQHHRSKTKKKEEQKIKEIPGCRVQARSREQWNSSRRKPMEFRYNSDKYCA